MAEDDYQLRCVLLRDALTIDPNSEWQDKIVMLSMAWQARGALLSPHSHKQSFLIQQQLNVLIETFE